MTGDSSSDARNAARLAELVTESLQKWREALLDLTRRNRLLGLKPLDTSALNLVRPGAQEVLERLVQSKPVMIIPGQVDEDEPQPPRSRQYLQAETAAGWSNLRKAYRNLRTRAMTHYMDTGLHVLYLSMGMLNWIDADGEERRSPLLLIPVNFVPGTGVDEVLIEPAQEDPSVNPAMRLKFRDLGVEVPDLDDNVLTEDSYATLARATRTAIRDQHDWSMTDDMWVTYFSASKEAMYRDLLDHADLIAEHPQVSALAASGTDLGASFHLGELLDELAPERLDTTRPPETNPTVLDADASQRAVVAAAVAGKSMVVAGPPGTGKSQTIANTIAGLLFNGRSVLFVSEKAAALEVVHNRLRHVGLAPYVLELHSHKATRATVSGALATALNKVPAPPQELSQVKRTSARDRREKLNAYANAMNEVRQPLGQSILAVIGQAALLNDLPVPDPARHLAATLDANTLAVTEAAAHQLARAWRPAQQGNEFLWRGVTMNGTLDPRLSEAQRALTTLQGTVATNPSLRDAFGWGRPSDAATLAAVLTHATTNPPTQVPANWWTESDLTVIPTTLSKLRAEIDHLSQIQRNFVNHTGVQAPALAEIPTTSTAPLDHLAATFVTPAANQVTATHVDAMTDTVTRLAQEVTSLRTAATATGNLLLLPVATTADEVHRLLRVLSFADRPGHIEADWLTSDGAAAATTAATELRNAVDALEQARATASEYFTDRCLEQDIPALQSRFANIHTGLRKLGGAYRADKRLVAEFNQPGLAPKTTISHLDVAAQWQAAQQHLTETEQRHQAILGSHYQRHDTNWNLLTDCLAQSREITAAYKGADLTTLADALNSEAPEVTQRLGSLRIELGIHSKNFHTIATQDAAWPMSVAWASTTFDDLTAILSTTQDDLTALNTTLHALNAATSKQWTLTDAIDVLQARDTVLSLIHEFNERSHTYPALLGDRYNSMNTNTADAEQAWTWVEQLRTLAVNGAPLSDDQIDSLQPLVPVDVAQAAAQWDTARNHILDAFNDERRAQLQADLDDYDDGQDLIQALLSDPDGQEEWFTFRDARAVLERHNLASIIDFCLVHQVESNDVANVARKALLAGWIDEQLDQDARLKPVRLADRESIVNEYRALDEELIATAIADVLQACKDHRPQAHGDQVAIITGEGQKRRRHMPVRELISKAPDVTLAIKPCFMMSPMSVSQYLPSDIKFDVVIFDEASQVKPADAINAIYRGRELIIVGDEKQMPPTSFFDGAAVGGGNNMWQDGQNNATDFESILTLATGSASFDTLMLNTHYRSRHEDLIAFSNHSFYRGELHTFPSASITTNDLGVAFFHVPDGQYQRGTDRNNPREAQVVIERLFHHYDTRPDLTVGIVAFSDDQAAAIDLALEEGLKDRPDLRHRVESANRLDGFFIKNLETVQGDERDVIIFSVGYGRDEHGKFTNHFGPLNKEGGWRRLNVAVTRARNRVEMVSSIRAEDISDTSNENVRHLRRYLDFAERGPAALAFDDGQTYGDPESPFEGSVIATVRSWGYDIESQVGTAGYRIDIGVRHPDNPNTFMLGIECDGYAYHSSKTARDRDRIRHNILTGLGWNLHHIWGTTWYRQRDNAEAALRQALQQAQHGAPTIPAGQPAQASYSIEYEDAELDPTFYPDWWQDYENATRPVMKYRLEITEPGATVPLRHHVEIIVEAESPIHRDLVYERLREWWNIGRVGNRIRQAIDGAFQQDSIHVDGDFLLLPAHAKNPHLIPVRAHDPESGTPRKIEQIHDSELSNAIIQYVRDSRGISKDELKQRLARFFGWTRTGTQISDRIDGIIDALTEDGILDGDDTRLVTQPSRTA